MFNVNSIKKYLPILTFIFLGIFCMPSYSHATTLLSNISNSNDKGTSIFRSNVWYAYKFTAGASATVSSVTLDLDHTASNYTGSHTYTSGVIRFYNDSAGTVGTQITGTLTYTSTNTGTGVTVYGTASGGTITIPSSGTFWMGLGCASCANIDYQEAGSSSYTGSTSWATILSSAGISNSGNAGSSWGTPFSTITYGLPMFTIDGTLADTTPPTITNVTSSTANGSYKAGDVIAVDVTFSETVTSTGNVTATLDTGRSCTFSVSSASSGTCNYTVQAGDTSSDLTVSSISGTIADTAGNAMVTFTPTTNMAANKAIVIDTTSPVISEVTTVTTPTTDNTPDYVFTTNEAGTISYGGSCGGATTSASSGSNTITFSTLTDGTYSNCTIIVTDTAGNTSNTLTATSFTIDTTAPTISSVSSSQTTSSAVITWTTNESSSSYVVYGTSNAYGSTTSEADTSTRVTSHSVEISGLSCGTTYYFNPKSKDSLSNIGSGSGSSFTTSSCPVSRSVIPIFRLPILTTTSVISPTIVSVPHITTQTTQVVPTSQSSINTPKIEHIIQTDSPKTNVIKNEEMVSSGIVSGNTNFASNVGNQVVFTKDIKNGIVHDEVKRLQEFLNSSGFEIASYGPGSKGKETNVFKDLSKQALKKFQKANNLDADGILGPITRDFINKKIKTN